VAGIAKYRVITVDPSEEIPADSLTQVRISILFSLCLCLFSLIYIGSDRPFIGKSQVNESKCKYLPESDFSASDLVSQQKWQIRCGKGCSRRD
jgi:hypothetical protein